MSEETFRYAKDELLKTPELWPERHYDSKGLVQSPQSDTSIEEQDPNKPWLDLLGELDNVYKLAALLPIGICSVIQEITEVLSKDTQGRIIKNLNRKEEFKDINNAVVPGEQEDNGKTIFTPGKSDKNDDEYIVDIFSSRPIFDVVVTNSGSAIELAYKAANQDDLDIKKYYTTRMTQLSMRFYQIMTTLAIEAGQPDYSYLMEDFDGTAVTTNDINQQHLIDYISKNQVVYDQKERQFQKTHTAENTLIMTRCMVSAAAQRERYLAEKYKANQNTYSETFSNDLLEDSRNGSDEKYKNAAYNYYKYLDSATKLTNTLLNITIDNASAKSQLANSGSDIFAQTPLPEPTPTEVDDGYGALNSSNNKIKNALKEEMKDAQNYSDGGSGGSFVSVNADANARSIFAALKKLGYDAAAACGILGNMSAESSLNPRADNGAGQIGICQWSYNNTNGNRWGGLLQQFPEPQCWEIDNQISYMYYECQTIYTSCLPNGLNGMTPENAALKWQSDFEGVSGQANSKRTETARSFFEQLANGN